MELTFYLICMTMAVFLYWIYGQLVDPNKQNLPPMPFKLPLFGHLLFLNPKRPFVTVRDFGKKLKSSVFRLYFGPDEIFVLNDYESIKEALVKQGENFVGRPRIWLLDEVSGRKGLILADGPRWKEQRRFSLSRLRDFGFGKSIIADKIQVEIDKMLTEIDNQTKTNGVFNLIHETRYCVANIINSILYDFTFPKGDVDFERFQYNMGDSMRIIGLAGFLMAFPVLRYLIPGGLGFWKILRYKSDIHGFHRQQIRKRAKELGEPMTDNDDFVTAYLKEAEGKTGEGHFFNEEQLLHIVADLFFAGQETTVTTLKWTFLFLIYNPRVQEKMFEEMKEKVGDQPSLEHRNVLPYCHAVVMESQRLGNIVPFGLMHSNAHETVVCGHRIPAGSTVLPNIWAVLMDDKLFPQPHNFYPERFLQEDGTLRSGMEGFIPFSMGKRLCLGESLARAELFMLLTAIVWRYRLTPDPQNPRPSLDPVLGTTVSPNNYLLTVNRR